MTRAFGDPRGWHKGVELKSARELAVMRQAGRIAALALAEMRDKLKPGVTGRQLDAIAEKVIVKHKARPAFKGYPGPYPYPFSTTISINEQLVHSLPTRRELREGDLVSLDCGVLFDGFYADNAVSVGVGRCSPEVEQLLAVTEQALDRGIAQARPGNRVGDVSAAIQQFVEGHGYGLTRAYTGHGIGRHMHEDPEVPNRGQAGAGRLWRPGMVVAIEPMVLAGTDETLTQPDEWTVVAADGSLTCHFEHTVAVTEGEPEILTKL
jgi:methionyl aminopeptidase